MAGWVGDIRRGANPKGLTPKSPEGAIKNALGMYASSALGLAEGQANKPGCLNALVRKGAEEVPNAQRHAPAHGAFMSRGSPLYIGQGQASLMPFSVLSTVLYF